MDGPSRSITAVGLFLIGFVGLFMTACGSILSLARVVDAMRNFKANEFVLGMLQPLLSLLLGVLIFRWSRRTSKALRRSDQPSEPQGSDRIKPSARGPKGKP